MKIDNLMKGRSIDARNRCKGFSELISDFSLEKCQRNLQTSRLSLQINDVDLSNQQKQISNNTTRLKDATDLSHPEVSSSDNEIKGVGRDNKASTHKKLILFSPWSSWSDCDKKCRQKRSRKCVSRRKCGSVKQIEEKSCPDYM